MKSMTSTVYLRENIKSINNSAHSDGGGIYGRRESIVFIDGIITFQNNSAEIDGGGVYIECSIVICEGVTSFTSNKAEVEGGGVSAVEWSSILLSGRSMLIENWSQQGAAILVYRSRMISYGKTWFINNSAVFGGAIHALMGNVIVDGDGSFIDNSAVNGGALLLSGKSKCYLVPNSIVSFKSNKAVQQGGAIYIDAMNIPYMCETVLL